MAIEKMKLISIAGKIEDFEDVVSKHLVKYDLHLENATHMFDNVKGLVPFAQNTSISLPLKDVLWLMEAGGIDSDCEEEPSPLSVEEIASRLDEINKSYAETRQKIEEIEKKAEEVSLILEQLEHMQGLKLDLGKIFEMTFIKFRFGRIPKAGYEKLKTYLADIDAVFVEGERDKNYVYGVYFMPSELEEKIDSIFLSLYFERIIISDKAKGTPKEAYAYFCGEREKLMKEKQDALFEIEKEIKMHKEELLSFYSKLKRFKESEQIKKYAAHTRESFYILAWAPLKTAQVLERELTSDKGVLVLEESPDIIKKANPPVRLKNPGIFKPFKMFVEMYGLPSYTELDPTPLLAITYVLMFGIMFGDVGHGLLLMIGGALLYKIKKMDLAAIVAQAGIFATIFGFIYGSFFGNEEILLQNPITQKLFIINPMHDITTMLILSVGLGVVLVFIAMLMNIINCVKNRNWGKALFDKNGLFGLVFYGYVIFLVCNMFFINIAVPTVLSAAVIAVSLILIFLCEPLTKLLDGDENWRPENVGEFILETFFELFEVILSYVTNTISFVRLGAFALGHGSMMSVVFILADMVGGAGSIIVYILGNALVIGLEGLVVGIQALRLEFYEMFSRYYSGGGRSFESCRTLSEQI